jgi:exonuclease III
VMIKLSTWNICLGLKNKKDYIYQVIDEKEIDVCLLQEVEIDKDYDANLLTKGQFKIEVEKNKVKARVAILIKDNVEYVRRRDLEGEDLGIVIIDLIGINKFRVINLYRSFNPNNNMPPLQFFNSQLQLINEAVLSANDRKIIIAGDFKSR